MEIDLFAGVAVSDFARAVDWYTRWWGASETFRAHDTEYVWNAVEHGYFYVLLEPDRAGSGLLTVFVEDYEEFLSSAAERGVTPEAQETYANGVRKATFRDPDGNEVGVGGAPVKD